MEFIGTLIFLLMNLLGQTKAAGFTLTAFILFITATALPTISIQIRRLRDANFNVAWIVLKSDTTTSSTLGDVCLSYKRFKNNSKYKKG